MTDSRKIAIYLRLSIEDDALDGKASTEQRESNSISNQRKMLLDYIRNDAELMGQEVAEFCDDGFSGTNMDRPGLQEMLKQVKQSKISCILVKDDCVIIEPTQKDLENQGFVAGSICF